MHRTDPYNHAGRHHRFPLPGWIALCGIALMIACTPLVAQIDTTRPDSDLRDPSGRKRRIDGVQELRDAVKRDSVMISQFLDSLRSTPEERMKRALAFNAADWQPSEADRTRRAEEIWRSQGFDKIFSPIPRVQLMSMSLGAIAMALGLSEDTSPRIRYSLLSTDSVSVIIFTTQADTVRVIVNTIQRPGVYSFNWDMNGSNGRRVPMGHYVAEVIVGRRLVLRKRIEVP